MRLAWSLIVSSRSCDPDSSSVLVKGVTPKSYGRGTGRIFLPASFSFSPAGKLDPGGHAAVARADQEVDGHGLGARRDLDPSPGLARQGDEASSCRSRKAPRASRRRRCSSAAASATSRPPGPDRRPRDRRAFGLEGRKAHDLALSGRRPARRSGGAEWQGVDRGLAQLTGTGLSWTRP
jgi:hypothetical protein